MDPISNSIASLLNALQATSAAQAEVPVPQLPALLAKVGQELSLTLLASADGSSQLALASGQVITAQGELPYPEGTQLLVRVLANASGELRLQTQEARPPLPSPILAPLLQGEASALLERLRQPEPAPELAPLVELMQLLEPAAAAGPGPAAAGPSLAQLQAGLEALPAPALAALKVLLPAGSDLASGLQTWLAQAQAGPGDPLQRLQTALDRHPELPAAAKEPLLALVKSLLTGSAEPGAVRSALAERAAPALTRNGPAQELRTVLASRSGPAPEQPETWQSWIKTAVQTLSDPVASPREAPFHAAQAKEGTAFYELALPWAPQSPLQLWVESDRDGRKGDPTAAETKTVLLGLKFTRLGETRLGLAMGPAGLQVRVWTEHPELLSAGKEQLEAELQDIGGPVDLKVLPLQPGPGGFVPSLKSLVTGPTVQMLG